jgi:hypothetical protein
MSGFTRQMHQKFFFNTNFSLINASVFLQNTSLLSPAAVPPQVGETLLFASTCKKRLAAEI